MEYDYRKILIAYMRRVVNEEGIDFVDGVTPNDGVTDAEIAELNRVSDETFGPRR